MLLDSRWRAIDSGSQGHQPPNWQLQCFLGQRAFVTDRPLL